MLTCSKITIVIGHLVLCLGIVQSGTCEATRDTTTEVDSRLMQLVAVGSTRVTIANPANGYITHDVAVDCYPGSEITTMAECQQGAIGLGITYTTATDINSSTMPFGCYFFLDAMILFHNTCSNCGPSSFTSEAICNQVPTPGPTLPPWLAEGRQYVKHIVGTNCDAGTEVTSLEECQYGASQLSVSFTSTSQLEENPSMPFGCHFYFGNLVHNACTNACGSTSIYTDAICIAPPPPTPAPTWFPTPVPATPAPTVPPAPAVLGAGPVSAKGDPHLQNIHGERFDLMKPGKHVLIHIPRRSRIANTMLKVEGDVQQMGGPCEMYFQELNLTGEWINTEQRGGLNFRADMPQGDRYSKWLHLGKVRMKIVHGRTIKGIRYLNFFVKDLSTTHLSMGGLLGEDDHTKESKRPKSCGHRVAL